MKTKNMKTVDAERIVGNIGTFGLIILALGTWSIALTEPNLWTVISGMLLWLLAVANTVITNLKVKLLAMKTD